MNKYKYIHFLLYLNLDDVENKTFREKRMYTKTLDKQYNSRLMYAVKLIR